MRRPKSCVFLQEGTRRRPNDLVRWYRTAAISLRAIAGVEYPRQTPDGDQVDILEVMRLEGGKIKHHRIYWGWFARRC